MAANSFGEIYRLTSFGESHGKGIGGVIDGCPAGIELDFGKIQHELDRRKPGQSKISTPRKESDEVQFYSGIFERKTTGTPIGFFIPNKNANPRDYSHLKDSFRPSHADFTYEKKYGLRDYRGGGRSSARETAARVVAGAIALQLLATKGITFSTYVSQVQRVKMGERKFYKRAEIDASIVRCPNAASATKMIDLIEQTRKVGDTLGGVISCIIQGVPVGLGEPVFDKLNARLASAMLGINAVKGFEIGAGFKAAEMLGSAHNDKFETVDGKVKTKTNYSGGVQGGISNGQEIDFSVAFKPVATIMQDQQSINGKGEEITIKGKGRHDPCVVPRAVPIVESMAAISLLDFLLLQQATKLH